MEGCHCVTMEVWGYGIMKLAWLFHALPTACRKFSQSACVGERRYRLLAVSVSGKAYTFSLKYALSRMP